MERIEKYESRPKPPATMQGLLMMTVSCLIGLAVTMFLMPPTAWRLDNDVPVNGFELWSTIRSSGLSAALFSDDLWRELGPRLAACGLAMLISAWLGYRLRLAVTPIVDNREHYAGDQLLRGKAALAAANGVASREAQDGERTIALAPGFKLARDREVRNTLILGAIGSGKTRIILFIIQQLLDRLLQDREGDHALFVHDTTGEIYDGFPLSAHDFAALHPHRAGSYAWDMGADLVEDADCEAAADQAVGQTGEPFWGKGAATLYAGCMIVTKSENGAVWGAPELYQVCLREAIEFKTACERCYPEAAKLIEVDKSGELSKTTVSLLLTFRANVLRTLRPLARAWTDVPAQRRFSFVAWVTGAKPDQPKIVLVQRSGRHPEMSASWIGMVMDIITSAVGDPQFSNSRTRSRSFVLDEAPALGQLRRWTDLLDWGRNKGIATFAAIQDLAQFRRIYRDAAASIFQRFLTKIVCAQTYGPETKALVDDEIGKRDILETETTTTIERGANGRKETVSATRRPKDVLIVRPEHLVLRLGIINRRVRALVIGLGDVLEIKWPIQTWRKRR
jgi:hypothetical protein